MTPLDVYLHDADEAQVSAAIGEYGAAIRELASADIFPGDLLPKNFGVTRYGRVVFYDYDEICRITECNFRRLPTASSSDEETAGEPWFSVGPHDIFPEELPAFLFPPGRARALFGELCGDLLDPAFWVATQDRIRAGIEDDVFPYPQDIRFSSRFGAT
jgi:isocitrate dehydrogenase kinase/phosphatase